VKFLIFFVCTFLCSSVYAESYTDKAFRQISKKVGVDESVLRAVCWVESKHTPHSYNHGDASKNDHAFGMCQILYSTAKSLGLKDERCANDFDKALPAERVYVNCKLFGTRTNIGYAAAYLKQKINKYNGDVFKAISAYNTGQYQKCKDGWLYYKGKKFRKCLIGGPVNFYYVKEVYNALKDER